MTTGTKISAAIVACLVAAVVLAFVARAAPGGNVALEVGEQVAGMANGALGSGTTFTVTCDSSSDGVTIGEATASLNWVSVYCENVSATSVFWGWPVGGTLSTTDAPCISTTGTTCGRPYLSLDVKRQSGLACKVASGTQAIRCVAGAP